MQIWDTAGQERFKNIQASYYKGANGILVVYDITNKESFENLSSWLIEIEKNGNKNVYKFLIGNKCDMEPRNVTEDQGKKMAEELKISYFETSALNGQGIKEAFEQLTRDIIKIVSKDKQHEELNKSIKLKPGKSNNILTKKKKCCE